MSEFPRVEDLSRRERRRIHDVQLTLAGLATRQVLRYEQPESGVGYTDRATSVEHIPEPEQAP